jgi:hypothetical protein
MTQKADLIQKSLIDVSASDLEQVEIDGQRERNWHKQSKRYQTDQDIQDAFNEKRLLKVGVTTNYRPITRLLNPANNLKYPPYLKNEALKILNELAHNWRKKLTEKFSSKYNDVLLPLTFLTCSEDYRQELLKDSTKIVGKEGTHTTGYTFDIDASSYYKKDGESFASVADPRRAQKIISNNTKNLTKIGGAFMHTQQASEAYNPEVTQTLIDCAREMHKTQKINLIVEYPGTQNCCLHISVKPNSEAES